MVGGEHFCKSAPRTYFQETRHLESGMPTDGQNSEVVFSKNSRLYILEESLQVTKMLTLFQKCTPDKLVFIILCNNLLFINLNHKYL